MTLALLLSSFSWKHLHVFWFPTKILYRNVAISNLCTNCLWRRFLSLFTVTFWQNNIYIFEFVTHVNTHYSTVYCVDLRGLGSVYRKIFWARLWSPISISRPLGREIEKLEIGLAQKIFRYTDPSPLRSTIHIGKVQLFWEGHKI